MIENLYKRNRDLDGTISCGPEDYYAVENFNSGLSAAKKVYDVRIKELEALLPHFKRIINISRDDCSIIIFNGAVNAVDFSDYLIELDELEETINGYMKTGDES